jgi:hypothetical protein
MITRIEAINKQLFKQIDQLTFNIALHVTDTKLETVQQDLHHYFPHILPRGVPQTQ